MTVDDGGIRLTVDGCSCTLSREGARQLQAAISAATSRRREYVRTTGVHREDGAYVVARRGAESAGNEKVFESFAAVERLYEALPVRITADDVDRSGITGSRRHLVVRHFAEHPEFDCEVVSRRPLTVVKTDAAERAATGDHRAVDDAERAGDHARGVAPSESDAASDRQGEAAEAVLPEVRAD